MTRTQRFVPILFLLLISTQVGIAPATAETRWTRVGPEGGGGLEALAASPSNPSVLYAGSRESLFRSDDAGATWRSMSEDGNADVTQLAVHPTHPETLLAISSQDELRRSNDGGRSWTTLAAPQEPDRPLLASEVLFASPGIAYAYQDDPDGDFRTLVTSRDAGVTWSTCGSFTASYLATPVPAFDPLDPDHVYLVVNRELIVESRDGCVSWQDITVGLNRPDESIDRLAITPDGELFASTDPEEFNDPGLFVSNDNGATWSWVYSPSALIEQILVDPNDAQRIFALSSRWLGISEDGGQTWRTEVFDETALGSRQTAMTVSRGPDAALWVLTGRGVERSTDGGQTWAPRNRGLTAVAAFERLRIHPNRPDELWGAGPGGLARSLDSGRTWTWIDTGIDLQGGFTDLQIDPRDNTLYAAGDRLLTSRDDGRTWTASPSDRVRPFRLAIDPQQAGRVVATRLGGFLSSPPPAIFENYGAEISEAADGSSGYDIFFDPDVANRIVTSSFSAISVHEQLDGPAEEVLRFSGGRSFLARSPSMPRRLWTIDQSTGDLWRSDDFGTTWGRIGGNLANQLGGITSRTVTSLSGSSDNPEQLFVTVDSSTLARRWRTDDGGRSWHPDPIADNVAATQILVDPEDPSVTWTVVPGGGVFRGEDGPLAACVEDQGLCMRSERFEVIVDWRDANGNSGRASRVANEIDTSGLFWFFDEANWELMVKVLDACPISDRFWVFSAATSDVDITMQVTDRWSGRSRTYVNPLGRPAAAQIDSDAFATCDVAPPDGADTSPPVAATGDLGTTLDLADGRFRLAVAWDTGSAAGDGRVAPLRTDDSGLFWFFDPSNWEMLVKVLDGCAINGHYWVLAGISSDVGYRLQIDDTLTGAARIFEHAAGTAAPALVEIEAIACRTAAERDGILKTETPISQP